MATLDRIIQMQQQGKNDNDIAAALKNEGVSPKEINDSLAQAKIKTAVSQDNEMQSSEYQTPDQYAQQSTEPQEQQYAPQQYSEQMPQQGQEQYAQYAEQPQQQYYPEQQTSSTETIAEIADQIIAEKLKETNEKIRMLTEFKNSATEDISDIKDRLKRIESTLDNLQRSIISKVGEFGQSNALLHKDLENLHGTVSKLMNPLVDNYNEMKKMNAKK